MLGWLLLILHVSFLTLRIVNVAHIASALGTHALQYTVAKILDELLQNGWHPFTIGMILFIVRGDGIREVFAKTTE
jgi:hypothetical protein